jgi:hypothetical protein
MDYGWTKPEFLHSEMAAINHAWPTVVRHDKCNRMHNRFNVQFLFISNRRVKIMEQSLHDSRSHTDGKLCCFLRFTLWCHYLRLQANGGNNKTTVTELKRDSEVMSRSLSKVLSRHLPGWTQESHGKPVRKTSSSSFKPGTSHRQV